MGLVFLARWSRDRRRHVIDMLDMVGDVAQPDHRNNSANEHRHQQILQRNTRHHKSPFLRYLGSDSKGSKSYFGFTHLLAHLAAVPMPPLAHGNGYA